MRAMLIVILSLFMSISYAGEYFYVSSTSASTVEAFSLGEDGLLTKIQDVKFDYPVGNSVISPDRQYVYLSLGNHKKSFVATLKIKADGTLEKVEVAKTPALIHDINIDPSGKYLVGCHLRVGSISTYELDAGVFKGKVVEFIKTAPRAHGAMISKDSKYAYFPHTKPNAVFQYTFNAGKLSPLTPAKAAGPANDQKFHEPRYIASHPALDVVYTSNEKGGGISSWAVAKDGTLTLKQTFKTISKDATWRNIASDIKLSPNAQLAFVPNRDISNSKSPEGSDCLSVFGIDGDGNITGKIGEYALGRHPRALHIDTSGKYIYAVSADSAEIHAFKINYEESTLELVRQQKTLKGPTWIISVVK
ncbi:MAG: beta-propeller fold lactonase family protein [Lentisphaeraceae bacterium]|nr:beta-propeller fold lactonase family protein [Lentisphaeraceae bacterium]